MLELNVRLHVGARFQLRSFINTPPAIVDKAVRPVPPKGNFSREAAEYLPKNNIFDNLINQIFLSE